jgi:cardiolipin synthase A/B
MLRHLHAAPLPVVPGPSFARGLWRIAGADVSSGNDVRLLHDGAMTFDAMIADIDAARRSVRLEGYIFRHDEVGQRFRDALCAAAARGVKVRLLVDWIGKWPTPRSFFKEMRAQGVDVRMFNPPGFRPWLGAVPRDHRKLLVVDDAAGITGGIGIGNEWRTGVLRRRGAPWRDTAVRVYGPAASDMAESFDRMWTRATGKERRSSDRYLIRRRTDRVSTGRGDPPASLVGVVQGEPFRLRVARALQIQAVSAEKSIWIASAYFIPSYAEVEALTGAARDGVDVRILVPHRHDHFWIRLLTRRFYRKLVINGVRIWEWQGEMMHAKTSVVDGRWVRVGSTDFNPLGIAINYELDVVIDDPIIGAEAAMVFIDDLGQSREITLKELGGDTPR